MPIKRTQNRGDQEGKIKASVPYDGTQVRNNKPDKQQDTQAKKERKKDEGMSQPGRIFTPEKEKNQDQQLVEQQFNRKRQHRGGW